MKKYRINAEEGIVYGLRGAPITKVCGGGYVQVNYGGRPVGLAHRMIWAYVHGPIPEGMQINHKNGVKTDNRIDNLELVTPSENMKHAYASGLASAVGEKNGRAKLTDSIARSIRASALTPEELAKRHSVSVRTIRYIKDGISWRHA